MQTKLFLSPHVRRLIDLALDEDDLGFDVTSVAFFGDAHATARLVAKQDLVLCGTDLVSAVFGAVDSGVRWTFEAADGERVTAGSVFASGEGNAASLLRGERSALNFLQRMTGIATQTRRYADALAGSRARITDTRKTLPGLRLAAIGVHVRTINDQGHILACYLPLASLELYEAVPRGMDSSHQAYNAAWDEAEALKARVMAYLQEKGCAVCGDGVIHLHGVQPLPASWRGDPKPIIQGGSNGDLRLPQP